MISKISIMIFQPTDNISNLAWNHKKTWQKRNVGLWLSDVVRANDVGDATIWNFQNAIKKFQQNTVT